jgi:gluconolactonase
MRLAAVAGLGVFICSGGMVSPASAEPVIQVLADGFTFPEGPVLLADGTLVVCDVPAGIIYSVKTDGSGKEVWLEFDGKPNGACLGLDGNLLVADAKNKRVISVDVGTKAITVLTPADQELHSPNDVTVAPDGTIFFSDPTWQQGWRSVRQFVWKVLPGQRMEHLREFVQPNGLKAVGDLLYVAEGATGKIFVANWKNNEPFNLLYTFENVKALDGMEADADGNLYVTLFGSASIGVLSPTGELIKQIALPGKNPTNVVMSPDGSTLYVTEAEKKQVLKITGF